MQPDPEVDENPFGEPIFTYTRREAIADGVLVDVSQTAREAGFRWPLALTAEVWSIIENIPEKYGHEDIQGRLWDVLMVARYQLKKAPQPAQELSFDVILHHAGGNRLSLRMVSGPGDATEPVLTIMLPDQD